MKRHGPPNGSGPSADRKSRVANQRSHIRSGTWRASFSSHSLQDHNAGVARRLRRVHAAAFFSFTRVTTNGQNGGIDDEYDEGNQKEHRPNEARP